MITDTMRISHILLEPGEITLFGVINQLGDRLVASLRPRILKLPAVAVEVGLLPKSDDG